MRENAFGRALFLMIIIVCLGSMYGVGGECVVSQVEGLRIRQSPDLNSLVVGALKKGEPAFRLGTSSFTTTSEGVQSAWAHVRSLKGLEGWVFAHYARPETLFSHRESISLFAKPSVESKIVGIIPPHRPFFMIFGPGLWDQVVTPKGLTGWVYRNSNHLPLAEMPTSNRFFVDPFISPINVELVLLDMNSGVVCSGQTGYSFKSPQEGFPENTVIRSEIIPGPECNTEYPKKWWGWVRLGNLSAFKKIDYSFVPMEKDKAKLDILFRHFEWVRIKKRTVEIGVVQLAGFEFCLARILPEDENGCNSLIIFTENYAAFVIERLEHLDLFSLNGRYFLSASGGGCNRGGSQSFIFDITDPGSAIQVGAESGEG